VPFGCEAVGGPIDTKNPIGIRIAASGTAIRANHCNQRGKVAASAKAQNLFALAESPEKNDPSPKSANDVASVGIGPDVMARKGPVSPPKAAM